MCTQTDVSVKRQRCPFVLKKVIRTDPCLYTDRPNHKVVMKQADEKSDKVCSPCYRSSKKEDKGLLNEYQGELDKGPKTGKNGDLNGDSMANRVPWSETGATAA